MVLQDQSAASRTGLEPKPNQRTGEHPEAGMLPNRTLNQPGKEAQRGGTVVVGATGVTARLNWFVITLGNC